MYRRFMIILTVSLFFSAGCAGTYQAKPLPFKTPAQVADEVRRCIDMLGEGGGYICGPDHHIKPDVSAAHAVALFEAARGYRRPGYTL